MERITPLELARLDLPRRPLGFSPAAVQDIVERCKEELQLLRDEIGGLRAENQLLQARLDSFVLQERTLTETLILAQRASDDAKSLAHKEADLIREKALQQASDVQRDAEVTIFKLHYEIDRLKREHAQILTRVRSTIEEHLRLIEQAEQANVHAIVKLETAEAEEHREPDHATG